MLRHVVVVGASAAGLSAAESLRSKGYDGKLTLIGEEPHPPYDRPPLTKQVLSGVWEPERVVLRDQTAISKLDADVRLGQTAVGLDVSQRTLRLGPRTAGPDPARREPQSGQAGTGVEQLAFDGLVIATGVRARRLPGSELAGVHTVRTLDDALALRSALLSGPRVVVVGAGFLGTEVAAAARGLGLDVTLVDPGPAPLQRQFGVRVADLVAQTHSDHGVRLRMNSGVTRFVSTEGRVTGVELTDRTVLAADVVVVAIGAVPATEWLADSRLPIGDGLECDATCRAAPGIYAAGDVASWYNPRFDRRMRVEHRLNATEQGSAVAANLLGADQPFAPVPYFWSDQYDVRLQAYGIFPRDATTTVVHGDPSDRRFAVAYVENGTVVGVLGWNCPPRDLRALRQLVADRAPDLVGR
ncbi:NAD(P)/FAD-dependent oxidoreductase [Kribbella italica]|uniref:NADPH-dependent 2,4-dienoyl-CoA reductase/sulfur reductase-like enzyme n=1 Tax=Kribbella italica TaxID=1540520 RepID=A0A7W9JGF0_9ACTN|nr:FAD/NAD(P)-binding oxidoreductase [Kribbella italica]MBB5841475.1 NADPH-dependent 2,4-dienoyl-CoA reductase/sulfur reductase-like enzyme [Kribbella italica]